MPFIGSINAKLRSFFFTHARLLAGRRCFIGCSGNFTIEQILTRVAPTAELHSNDVSLYSGVIGAALTRTPFPMRTPSLELQWLNDYLEEIPGPHTVAMIVLFLEMLKYEKRKNDYSKSMWDNYVNNWKSLHERTLAKVKVALDHTKIASYTTTDVHDYYPCASSEDIAIGFLPTYVGGYEKLFSRLEESFSWPRPTYQMLTEERREATIQKMVSTDYILYDDRPRDLPCVARVDLFGHRTVYVYSSLSLGAGVFRKTLNEKVLTFDLLGVDEGISPSAAITMKEIPEPFINHYRNMYLSKHVQPGSGGPCYLVFADKKLFGFLIFNAYSRMGKKGDLYMLSDFVVPSTRYTRLAKLLLMVTQCQDTKRILEERLLSRRQKIYTTAFTDKPVSMKYRGVYELVKRGKGFLNYATEFNDTTFQEVVSVWMKKYKQR
ncbi:MAG: hypothetical protein ABSD38_32260 [Syntrophorhabdales bacterium]|jgi:hypothetical protein